MKPGHRPVIQAALDDWWLTTDPAHPDLTAAAEQIELYLTSSGYRVTPDTDSRATMIHRLAYTVAVLAFASSLTLAWSHHLAPAIGCLLAAAFCTDLADRRRPRADTQQPTHSYDAMTGNVLTGTEPSKIIRITEPLTEAEYEAFRAKWIKTYGDGDDRAHIVEELDDDDTPICTCMYGQRCPHCRDYTPTPKD